jgi:hypothetical protein
MVEEIDDVPSKEMALPAGATDLPETISNFAKPILALKLWLLAWRIDADGRFAPDKGRTRIMNEQGADAYCSWLEALTAVPIPFSRHKADEIAWKLRFNESTIAKMLIENEDEWDFDFDKYADMLCDISDVLGTAALNGSLDGKTLERVTAQYQNIVQQRIGDNQKGGFRLPSIFRKKENEQ